MVLEPVPIEIYSFKLERNSEDSLRFSLRCSSGTYVRSIARDAGVKIGSPCHCVELIRRTVGPFSLESANGISEPFAEKGFIPFDRIDLAIPPVRVDFREERLVLNGQDVIAPRDLPIDSKWVKLVSPREAFLGIGRVEGRAIHPHVVFHEQS